jgi:hypothetical protein
MTPEVAGVRRRFRIAWMLVRSPGFDGSGVLAGGMVTPRGLRNTRSAAVTPSEALPDGAERRAAEARSDGRMCKAGMTET